MLLLIMNQQTQTGKATNMTTANTITGKELLEKYNKWHAEYKEIAELYGHSHPMVMNAKIRLSALRAKLETEIARAA